MIYRNGKVSDVQIAYIGGGSRGWAWTFMTDLALEKDMSGTIRLYDLNEKAAKANEEIGNRVSEREEAVGKWKYETCTDMEQALTGADFIVISILPGSFDEMAVDVHTPERLGIYQSVGDTAGPGGIIRALRTIPMFVKIAEDIKKYAPSAWVINYTNPMSLCVKTLYHTFPEIKAFGCCHEVFGTQKVLKEEIVMSMYWVLIILPGLTMHLTKALICSRFTENTLTNIMRKATMSQIKTGRTALLTARTE